MDNKGCLLIHGFTGCRNDLAPLRERLDQLGYKVSAPVLKGHETSSCELKTASRYDWVACAQDALDDLRSSCLSVIVIGFSMGGLLAANLCQSNDFDGIVFINTPVYYWGLGRMVSDLHSNFKPSLKKYAYAFRNTPFHAMLEFQLLLSKTKSIFQNVKCRSLVVQSADDDVVNPKSAEYIFSRLQGQKEIKIVPQGKHVVLLSDRSAQVCSYVQHFLKGL